ncbi:hypothetical protein [Fusobacterium sp.]|uniref:DNA polymerase III subunit delta n=1 Tax=Fusobacterium sp. TaxID=68766 RepID=UPI00261C7178|nr:hypothetical protein [Fusobacterium sp.]
MVYFLYGDIPLQLKYEELLKKIKDENKNIPEQHFDITQDEIDNIFQALSTNSMFIPKSLIVIKRLEKMKGLNNFIKSLAEFNYSQKIIILIYEEELNDYGKTVNPLEKALTMKNLEAIAKPLVARKESEKKSLQFFVEKKLNCSEYEAEKFIEMVGEDFLKIKNEIAKIENFLNGEPFKLEKVKHILSINTEYNLYKLTENFIYNKNSKDLIEHLRAEKNYMLFLNILSEELSTLFKLKDLSLRGIIGPSVSYNKFKADIYPNIKNNFKINNFKSTAEYPLFLKFKYLDLYSIDFYKKKMKDTLIVEYKIKTGQIEEILGMEKFILEFFI